MGNFKINCRDENENFIPTQSYQELLRSFSKLKKQRGLILHVVGAPGVGKSANIYQATHEIGLEVYEAGLILDSENMPPRMVFELTLDSMKNDLGVKTDLALYRKLKEFDMVLFADRFHDSHLINPGTVGFSQWSADKGWGAFPYYWYCVREYLKQKNEFRNLNVVFQTSWRVHLGGRKRDLFTELGIISRISICLLKIPFQVVEISYSPLETINIVKSHFHNVDEDRIRKGIALYHCKPRFICEALKTEKI
jgi:hypothetical protein